MKKKIGSISIVLLLVINFFLNNVNATNSNSNVETKENTNQINELNLTANESLNTTEKEKEQNNNVVEENIQETENSDTENEISVESVENSNEVQVETKEQRLIEDGYYYISSALDENQVLDISQGSLNNSANLQIWKKDKVLQQKFKVIYSEEDSTYELVSCKSGKAIDVEGGYKKAGTNVWQYTRNQTAAQKWIIEDAKDGYVYIKSKCNDLYMDVQYGEKKNGTNIQVYPGNGTTAQKFKFVKTDAIMPEKTIEDGYYEIETALDNKKVLDIDAASKNNGALLQIWNKCEVKQQKFKITYTGDGFYVIRNVNSNKVLDVQNAGTANGTKVQQFDYNGTNAQKWIISKNADGYYSIVSLCGDKYLDISNGSSQNGTKLQIFEGNGTNAQKFKFNSTEVIEGTRSINDGIYKISSFENKNSALDISGASKDDSANVQLWSYCNVLQQKFRITYDGNGYYSIKNVNSGKFLDVAGGIARNGTNVQQYEGNNSLAQKWIIRKNNDNSFNIISACDDMFLDMSNGTTTNGTNIQIYRQNNTNAQKFYFEQVTAIELTSGTYGSSGLKVKGDSNGQNLRYYKIGDGPNVYFATFAVHGFEDGWNNDGQVLTRIAEDFQNKLIELQDNDLASKWTIYIFPSVNPDGEYHGWTNNGPGRTSIFSAAPNNKGIDINRCWSAGYTSQTKKDRNYNGTEPFQSYESRALRDFLLNKKSQNGQTVLVDLHGWLNETIGDEEIGRFYRSRYGMSKHIYTYGQGYLVNWARTNLGSNGRTARASLVELPEYDQDSSKYINATIDMLRSIN